jgi:tetratricopeptide (TPR) repeat protein
LAFAKLGEEGKAQEIFQSLVRAGQAELAHQAGLGYVAKFGRHQSAATRQAGAHYLIGLGYLGEGKRAEAKAEFQQSLERDQNLLGARTQLAALEERSGSGAE